MVFNTNTSAKSGFALLAQVWKVVLQQLHKCEKWFSTRTQVRKVVCNTKTSLESGFATPAQVRQVVLQHQHKCEKWFSTRTQVRKVILHC